MIKLERVNEDFGPGAAVVKITAPIYWWKNFDDEYAYLIIQYNAESLREKIESKRFVMNQDFSIENLKGTNEEMFKVMVMILNETRDEYLKNKDVDLWFQMIQLLPESYNVTRTVYIVYHNLSIIYYNKKDSPYPEWRAFCTWIKELKMPVIDVY